MKKIVMTGGGTGGHVIPNIALMPRLIELGYEIHYIGSKNGIEKDIISKIEDFDVKYYEISSGKLRRKMTFENVKDGFRVVDGYFDALKVLRKIKPDVIFSKGGYVTVPVVYAGKTLKIPSVIHESDLTQGLANRLSTKYATAVCTSFESTAKTINHPNVIWTGTPIRKEILTGDVDFAKSKLSFQRDLPIILLMGGSLGSVRLNEVIREMLKKGELSEYNIIHLTGKGNLDTTYQYDNYEQFEFLSKNLNHVLAVADLVITRGGANALFELVALRKPNIIIPLPKGVSRGDQVDNAKEFKAEGFSEVIYEEDLTAEALRQKIDEVLDNKAIYITNMIEKTSKNAVDSIVNIIDECSKNNSKNVDASKDENIVTSKDKKED